LVAFLRDVGEGRVVETESGFDVFLVFGLGIGAHFFLVLCPFA
jgi:hypothetical protein